jgi:hypothetical protein
MRRVATSQVIEITEVTDIHVDVHGHLHPRHPTVAAFHQQGVLAGEPNGVAVLGIGAVKIIC